MSLSLLLLIFVIIIIWFLITNSITNDEIIECPAINYWNPKYFSNAAFSEKNAREIQKSVLRGPKRITYGKGCMNLFTLIKSVVCLCGFVKKVFGRVLRKNISKILPRYNISVKSLYRDHSACLREGTGMLPWFDIQSDIKQGCALSIWFEVASVLDTVRYPRIALTTMTVWAFRNWVLLKN